MDGINNALTRQYVLNPIAPMTDGRSFNLANGQPGLFSFKGANQSGLQAITDLKNKKGEEFIFEVGTGKTSNKGGSTTKNMRSASFKSTDVVEIILNEAKDATQSSVIIGFDGFDTEKNITLTQGAPSNLSISLGGEAVGYYGLGYETMQNFTLVGESDPDCITTVCPPLNPMKVVSKAVEEIKNRRLKSDVLLSDLMDVRLISSCKDAVTTTGSVIFYNVEVEDLGDSAALAAVAGQYGGYEVIRVTREGVVSKYQLYKSDGSGLPVDYVEYANRVKTNCGATCPVGYTSIPGTNLYNVSLEDNGVEFDFSTLTLASGTVITSSTKVGQVYGTGNYNLVVSAELVAADFAEIITAQPTVTIDETVVVVDEVCVLTAPPTATWVAGETCTTAQDQYFIDLDDDDCGNTRLAELQAAYPQLTIVEETTPTPAGCRRRYSTLVATNMVCDECNPDDYSSEAPTGFGSEEWTKIVTYPTSDDCKVGIKFTPKSLSLCQEKHFAGMQASIHSQLEINVSGGEDFGGSYIGYDKNTEGAWAVTRQGRAFDGTGWGDSFCGVERISSSRETADLLSGDYIQDSYKGMETKLEPCKQYDTVSVRIKKDHLNGVVHGIKSGEFNYNFIIERHSFDMYRPFFNSLASGNVEVNTAF